MTDANTPARPLATLAATLMCGVILAAGSAQAGDRVPSQKVELDVETVADGLENPWSVEVLPDGAYIVSERPGRMRIVRDGKISEPLQGLPDLFVGGQGGLLDIALSPDFQTSRRLFFTASIKGEGGQGTALFQAALDQDDGGLSSVKQIFAMNRFTGTTQHFGSRIAIAKDGSLFFGIGDRGEMDRAQDVKDHAGSILHVNADGRPADGNVLARQGALPEIWSIGHRNPQGIAIDPADGMLYTVEHGARGGDEINAPKAGENYGWPVISYGKHYTGAEIGVGQAADGYQQPVYYWDPSIAPGAIDVYRGAMFPEWNGSFLVAALKYQLLARMERDDSGAVVNEERLLDGAYGRIRDVKVAPDGSVLLVTDEENGALLRITRAPST